MLLSFISEVEKRTPGASTLPLARVIGLLDGIEKSLSLYESIQSASVFSIQMRLRNYQVKEGFLKGRAQSCLESLWYHQRIVKVCTQPWLY